MIIGAIVGALVVGLAIWYQAHRKSLKWAGLIGVLLLAGALIAETLGGAIRLGPKSYQECIFEKMPGVSNDVAAVSIAKGCQAEHFYIAPNWEQPTSPRANKCIADRARQTPSKLGAGAIGVACRIEYPD